MERQPFFWHQQRDDGGQASLRQLSEGFSTRRGHIIFLLLAMRGTLWQKRTGLYEDELEERKHSSQQERKQQQRVRATNHRSHQPMRGKANWHLRRSSTTRYSQEEDAEVGTKGDQDRKRQAVDAVEQKDQSPPKRGVGRPVKKGPTHA